MSGEGGYRNHIDPEYRRWGRKYPHFPGVAECVRLLRARNVRGAWVDIIAHELAAHAAETLPELEGVFRSGEGEWVRLMVLHAIADARLPAAVPLLSDVAHDRHPVFAPVAERGLKAVGTAEARAALWAAQQERPATVSPPPPSTGG